MNEGNLYTIKKGDTFWDLEEEWGIRPGMLQELNPKLDPRKLQIGQEIQIEMPNLLYLKAEKIPEFVSKPIINPDLTSPSLSSQCIVSDLGAPRRAKTPTISSYESSEFGISATRRDKARIYGMAAEEGIKIASKLNGLLDLENIRRTKLIQSNELWHIQKNGIITHPWKQMKNGASHWRNHFVKSHRTAFRTASNAKKIGGSLLKKAGPVLLIADVALGGEIKPSHIVTGVLIGASSTGVGAIFAGIYFVADVGTELVSGTSISNRLDGWAAENDLTSLKLYDGYY